MSEIENDDYKEKDIVWAKLKGNWWPSVISQISYKPLTSMGKTTKEKIYTIELIGEKTNFKVSSGKIESFIKNYEKHANTKNISLLKSIELAKKLWDKKNKKENEEQNKNIKDNKDTENAPKFLKKKRMNDKIVLDEEQNEERKDTKMKDNEEQNKEIISTPKNNIKINININVTNNNPKTMNFNSFPTTEVIHQSNSNNNMKLNKNISKFNYINYSSMSANENTGNKNGNKKEKIFNTSNMDNNNINNKDNNKGVFQTKDDEQNIKSLKKEKNSENKEKTGDNREEKNKKKDKEDSIEENDGSDCEEDNEELILSEEIVNESIQKILNCQIQMSNISSQKTIIKELIYLSEKFHEYYEKNQKDNDNCEIYNLSKDLIPILMNLTYNKNTEIMSKSSEIISFLNEKIIMEIFHLSQKDKNDLIESFEKNMTKINKEISENNKNEINLEEENFKEGQNIIELINKKAPIKSGISDIHTMYSKRGRPKKISINSELSSEIYSSKINEGIFGTSNVINEKNYCEEFIKIISSKDKIKMESEFKEKCGDFFETIYDKNNADLDNDIAKMRKNTCIKVYKAIKKINPEINRDLLKKMIVYYEYKIRNSNNEKIYVCKIKELFEIIKERLCDNDKPNNK